MLSLEQSLKLKYHTAIKPIIREHDHDDYFEKRVRCGRCGSIIGSWKYGRDCYDGEKEKFVKVNKRCKRCRCLIDWEGEKA